MGIFQTINCWKVDNLHQPTGLKLKLKIHFPKNSNLQFKRLHDSIVNWDSQFANFPNGHTDVQARIRKKRRAKFSLILFTEQRYVGRELTKQKFESFIPMYLTFNFEENWRTINLNIKCHKTLHNTLHSTKCVMAMGLFLGCPSMKILSPAVSCHLIVCILLRENYKQSFLILFFIVDLRNCTSHSTVAI